MYGMWQTNNGITAKMEETSCSVSVKYSKAGQVINMAVAAAAAPVALPVSAWLAGASAVRLIYGSNLKKEVIRFIRAYVS